MNSYTSNTDTEPGHKRSISPTPQALMEQVFVFPEGLPAFEEVRQFFFACKPETAPFIFMRAIEPAQLGFVCVDPFMICPGYKLDLSNADAAALDIKTPDEVMILSIVTPSPDVHKTTANLQSPLCINLRTRQGRQLIYAQQDYPVRYFIWEELKRMTREAPLLAPAADGKRSAA